MTEWLTRLGVLVAGQMPVADAKLRVRAYAIDLDFPALCFTDQTRVAAAKRFTWFPSFAELSAFFEEYARPQRTRLARLQALASCPLPTQPKRYQELSADEKMKFDSMMDSWQRAG